MENYGRDILQLRQRAGISLRELSRRAEMSPASLSAIENGLSSPTLATMEKILKALGTNFASFFASMDQAGESPVFLAAEMHSIFDQHRMYTLLLPNRSDLKFQIITEELSPKECQGEWEVHDFDLGGTILEGGPVKLEIDGVDEWELSKGDAFYIKAGQKHRATNISKLPVKQITVADPAGY